MTWTHLIDFADEPSDPSSFALAGDGSEIGLDPISDESEAHTDVNVERVRTRNVGRGRASVPHGEARTMNDEQRLADFWADPSHLQFDLGPLRISTRSRPYGPLRLLELDVRVGLRGLTLRVKI